MNRHLVTATALILTFSYRDELLQRIHQLEDRLLPLDPIDLSIFNELEEETSGWAVKGTDTSYLNCSSCNTTEADIIASGWSKLVYTFSPNSVLKRPNLDGRAYQNCFHLNYGKSDWEIRCRLELLKGFVREIKALIGLLGKPGVIKVMSYCIPHDPVRNIHGVNIITERGTPLDVLLLVQMSTSQKRVLFKSMVDLFKNNPSLRLHDFRRQQVVLVDGVPKVVDFDDAYFSVHDDDLVKCDMVSLRTSPSDSWVKLCTRSDHEG